jgi:hypothetical protein
MIGVEFDIEYSYSNIIMAVYFTVMYMPGLPLLVPVLIVYLIIMYWKDKIMCK